jgi:hypothetical protein
MKASKRIILLAAFVVLSLAAHGQHFEWARTIDGYDQSSSSVGNKIACSMTDTNGNPFTGADKHIRTAKPKMLNERRRAACLPSAK